MPVMLHGQPVYAMARNLFLESLISMRPDRKLVLVQLNGGNDGLNTFVPLDQYGNLQNARPGFVIPEEKLLPFTGSIGLHPSFPGVKTLYEMEKCLVIQGVGYPQPNLSHFRSKDIITSGSSAQEVVRSGWIGRLLNEVHPLYPEGYPSEEHPHPVALTIGSSASQTCQGYSSNLGAVIKNLNTEFQSPEEPGGYPETPFGKELEYIAGVMQRTEVYLDGIAEAAALADNQSALYPETGNNLSNQLKIVARLIAGGLKTQVYVVSLGGWDTHANQIEAGIPEGGRHGDLLSKLSDALVAFQDDLKLLGVEDDVMGLVFTEFGRRIMSNASLGTDHGTSWPAILFGSQVNPKILGSNPVIPELVDKKDNLPMQYDFRSLYASLFTSWFEAGEESVSQLLFDSFETLPILKEPVTGQEQFLNGEAGIYPNPVKDNARVRFVSGGGKCSLVLYSSGGQQLRTLMNRRLGAAPHTIHLDLSGIAPGSYYLVVADGTGRFSLPFIKM